MYMYMYIHNYDVSNKNKLAFKDRGGGRVDIRIPQKKNGERYSYIEF